MKNKIRRILLEDGISPAKIGFHYLVETIEKYDMGKSFTNIFREICEKHNRKGPSISKAISDALIDSKGITKKLRVEFKNIDYIAYVKLMLEMEEEDERNN